MAFILVLLNETGNFLVKFRLPETAQPNHSPHDLHTLGGGEEI